MNEVERRLSAAVEFGLSPSVVSPSRTWFAWRPVRLMGGGWAWMRRVTRFRPLGLFNEYYEIRKI